MTRMDDFGGEIGRGRRHSGNDSSSSRESSPRPVAQKRSFSPAGSEDGIHDSLGIANDDTPPPPERPIIRQAVAFSSGQPPPSINTYEAVPAAAPKPGFFLPGQEVPQPPKVKTQKPKKSVQKRPRKTEAYPGQTTRFRLQTYDATPSTMPPIDHGSGPYSSMYRASSAPRQNSPSVSNSSNGGYPSSSTTSSNPHAQAARAPPSTSVRPPPPPAPSRHEDRASRASHLDQHGRPSPYQNAYSQHPPPPTLSSQPARPTSSTASGSHYRNNYEANMPDSEMAPPLRESQHRRSHTHASGSNSGQATSSPTHKRKQNQRMVTILIQDVRSGTTDHQLAEVKIALRPGDNPQDGYWADARELSEQLQISPSRIDGPARAYTLRGKYRQFILRVSPDNVDEFISSNIVIQPDRTLDLVVEMLPPLGAPPPPPRIPPELMVPNFDECDTLQPNAMDVDQGRESLEIRNSRKRINSPSFDDYDNYDPNGRQHPVMNKVPRNDYAWEHSPRQTPRHSSSHLPNHPSIETVVARPKKRGPAKEPSSDKYQHAKNLSKSPPPRPPQSPPPRSEPLYAPRRGHPEDELEPADDPYILAVDRMLQEDQTLPWADFFKARAGKRVCDVVKQYEFLTQRFEVLVGKEVPTYQDRIQEIDIINALKIDDPDNYLSVCKETTQLLRLYGRQGYNCIDPRVASMVTDQSPPAYNANPHKRLLHLLREVDKTFTEEEAVRL